MPEALPPMDTNKVKMKPFPRYCHRCRKKSVWPATVAYTTCIRLDDQLHDVHIPGLVVPRCQECGELYFDNDAEDQVDRAFRAQLHLLQPEQIRANRLALGLSQEELAARLGVPLDLLDGWEDDRRIQTRAQDNLLRCFFALPAVRAALCGPAQDPAFGGVADGLPPAGTPSSIPIQPPTTGDAACPSTTTSTTTP